ncbi:MAG: hypothetical protein KHX42_11445 [Prevotella sp.]|nr:hypothetical protein [Prevotella sp.]
MKKLLLFACAALTSMTVGAQTELASITKLAHNNVKEAVIAGKTSTINNAVAAAPALDALAGNYTETVPEGELISCSPAVVSIDGTNVKMEFANGAAVVTGTYDAATGVINIGEQACGSKTDSRGTWEFLIRGLASINEAAGTLQTTNELSFTVDADGNIDCNQLGYFIKVTKFTAAAGSSYTDGQYDGATWNWAQEPRFIQCNGVQKGHQNGRNTNGWEEFSNSVSIEDYEYSVNVYNYCEMGCLSIDVNEDGTVSIAMGQPMADLGFETQEDIDNFGKYLCIRGVDLEGNNISTNLEKETSVGTISGNTITITEYTRMTSLISSDQRWYTGNWYADGMTITLNTGNFKGTQTNGIEVVKPTLEERAKNSKTYNLMGQQVNRATAKGLLIRDGKKYIKKN